MAKPSGGSSMSSAGLTSLTDFHFQSVNAIEKLPAAQRIEALNNNLLQAKKWRTMYNRSSFAAVGDETNTKIKTLIKEYKSSLEKAQK